MSAKKTERVACPYCSHEQSFESYENIDLTDNQKIKEKILNDELFTFTCEECGKKAIIAFPCLFSNLEKKYLIWLVGGFTDDDKQALDRDFEGSALSDREKAFAGSYTRRIVGTVNELKEKILIADDGLDDRIVEVLKILCINEVISDIMQYTLQEVRYNSDKEGRRFLILVFAEKEPSMIEITSEMYDTVKGMFMDDIEKYTPSEGFAQIDAFWARDMLDETAEDAADESGKEKMN